MRLIRFLLSAILLVSVQHNAKAQPIQASIKMYQGRPVMMLNDQPTYPIIYSLTDVPGGRWTWEEVPRYNLKQFCQLGVKLIQVDLAFDHVWKHDNTIVLDTAVQQLQGILDVCPNAAIFIRFHVNPPKWWQQKYPAENTRYADVDSKPDINWGLQRLIEDDEETPTRTSLASARWTQEATDRLSVFLQQLQQTKQADRIAGIQVAGGVYGEWHYWGFIDNEPDMSEPMLQYFRHWLHEKYKTDRALQKAWNKSSATLAQAELPTLDERRTAKHGIFRDPATEQNVIDYYECQHTVVADDIIHFCKTVKENWKRPIITGAFYGYFYAVFGREAAGGHLELQRVLRNPHVDYLSGPGTYYPDAVNAGDPYRSRSLINSVLLHGKLWLDEMDQQPPLVPLKDKTFSESLQKSVATVRRNMMFTASKGMGLWFYDFGPSGFNGGARLNDHGSFGWWDEPTLRKNIKEVKALLEQDMSKPYRSDADVLLVHDTKSFYHLGSAKNQSALGHWTNNWVPVSIFRSGVVHDVIHLDDLDLINPDQYRAIVMVNTFVLTAQQIRTIRERLAKNGRHIIWIYAPGYSDGQKLDEKHISHATGITVTSVTGGEKTVQVDTVLAKHYSYSVWNTAFSPLFSPNDTKAEILGRFLETGSPALARKTVGNSTSWFMSLPAANEELWRNIFKNSGAHLYSKTPGPIFYQGGNILTIHTKDGGAIDVALKNGKEINVNLEPNSTTLLDSNTGEVILK